MGSAKPSLFGILGYPLSTTWSPAIHEAGFSACGLDHRYLPLPVPPTRLKRSLEAFALLGVKGFNVTVPHKEAIVPLLTSASPLVRTLGAANTVLARPRGWHGENTDVAGFVTSLWRHEKALTGKPAVVLGSGGAARAVVYALLRHLEMSAVLVVSRKVSKARELARWAGSLVPGTAVAGAALSDTRSWRGAFREAVLVVQATPVGMGGSGRIVPPSFKFSKRQVACDLVYGARTDFLVRAKRDGARAKDGSGMLLAQAALAFELFTGKSYPWQAVQQELKRRGA